MDGGRTLNDAALDLNWHLRRAGDQEGLLLLDVLQERVLPELGEPTLSELDAQRVSLFAYRTAGGVPLDALKQIVNALSLLLQHAEHHPACAYCGKTAFAFQAEWISCRNCGWRAPAPAQSERS